MSVRDAFAQRFSLLRSVHRQTYKELGDVLWLSSNSINEWTLSKNNFPNPDKLVLLANLYGVSVDWLLGRTDTLYVHDIIASVEDSFVINLLASVYDIPESYRELAGRKASYSLGVRANIITLVITSQYSAMAQVLGKGFHKKPDFEDIVNAHSVDIRNAFLKKLLDQDDLVGRLLRKEKVEPPFDVEFAFRQLKK